MIDSVGLAPGGVVMTIYQPIGVADKDVTSHVVYKEIHGGGS